MRVPAESYSDAGPVVLLAGPTGPDAEFEPTVAQHLDRGRLARELGRVPQVLVQHGCAQGEPG